MKPINHLQELSRIPENKEFECMTLLEKVMFLYKRLTRKQNNLISGKNIMTINGTDILQSGNLEIESGTAGVLYINTTGDDGNLTPEDIEKLNTENGNVVIINDNEYYHKMYENSVYYAFVNVDTITTTHISYKAIYINKDRNTFNKEESTELINYNDLINKPSLNGVVLSGNVYSSELGISYDDLTDKPTIPTKTSDLTNDSGFITNTDYATQDSGGIVKLTSSYGTELATDKKLRATIVEYANYNGLHNNAFIGKRTLENVITGKGIVKNTDYATQDTAGVIKISNGYGSELATDKKLRATVVDYSDYRGLHNNAFIGKRTLENVIVGKELVNQTQLGTKQDTLVSGTNIKTINGNSVLGSGNIEIQGGGGTGNFNDLTNRPSYNGTVMSGSTNIPEVPTKTSDLTNDSGFVTNTYHDNSKQDILISSVNIKTINNESILGSGNIEVSGELNPTELLNYIYPIGSIYMSVNNVSPQTFLGGTWEQLKDKFLLGAGDTYTAGDTGGEEKHTLTVDEMPSHDHNILCGFGDIGSPSMSTDALRYQQWGGNNRGWHNFFVQSKGDNVAHNNMPPYLTVYMWKRTN